MPLKHNEISFLIYDKNSFLKSIKQIFVSNAWHFSLDELIANPIQKKVSTCTEYELA